MTVMAENSTVQKEWVGQKLTNTQREDLISELEENGSAILPIKLPQDLMDEVVAEIDEITAKAREADASVKSIKRQNMADLHPAFLKLCMYGPALQLCYDSFGPMFQLNQSNFQSRMKEDNPANDFLASTPWHADGPRLNLFPHVNGAMGLHYLKFGYFFTDLTDGKSSSLQVVRGSHKRSELDGKGKDFDINDYKDDLIQYDCEPGTIVAFHQAQWHAAGPNESGNPRKNAYISYSPTWMRPLDREPLREGELDGRDLSAEERWMLGDFRPALRFWLPSEEDKNTLARYARD